jgi:uncharacterized protein YeaO (DUF488 family)
MLKIKRAYEKAEKDDGIRILVDRIWPRGVSKQKLKLDRWEKEVAPSDGLRKWFGHDPKRWQEFKRKYRAELRSYQKELRELRGLAKKHTVTLVYSAKDETHNQAAALKEALAR